MGRKEAARLLGVTVRTVSLWTRQGLLTPRFIGDQREMHFSVADLQMLRLARADKSTDIWQVKALALQALSAARATELRLAEVFDHLGLNVVVLDRTLAGVRALAQEATISPENLRDPRWVRYWGSCFFAMDEVYLELAGLALEDDEPWKRFMDLANDIQKGRDASSSAVEATRASDELQLAYKYLAGGARHLWYVGYMFCRREHGWRIADVVFNGSRNAVDELMAILH